MSNNSEQKNSPVFGLGMLALGALIGGGLMYFGGTYSAKVWFKKANPCSLGHPGYTWVNWDNGEFMSIDNNDFPVDGMVIYPNNEDPMDMEPLPTD